MTIEFVLILSLYGFIVIGTFLGDSGPIETFKSAAPRFAAKLEKDISIGSKFKDRIRKSGRATVPWKDPSTLAGGTQR